MGTKPHKADLMPALGLPSEAGPCHVVHRIENEVRSPAVRKDLQHQVEKGKALSNPDARKVYKVITERGAGLFPKMELSSHAQYRMDLRGITVPDLRFALKQFSRQFGDWKSQGHFEYENVLQAIRRGEPIEYLFKKWDLFVVFTVPSRGTARLITVYWKGMSDPKAPGICVVPHSHDHSVRAVAAKYRPQDLSGVKLEVKDSNPLPNQPGSDTPGANERKPQALPSPPNENRTEKGPHNFNTPGPSGTGQDGKSIHKDKARTQSEPGGEHPGSNGGPPASIGPGIHTRRPGVYGEGEEKKEPALYDDIMPSPEEIVAMFLPSSEEIQSILQKKGALRGKPYPGSNRQKKQRGTAKLYFQKFYRRNKAQIRTRMKKWYTLHKNQARFKWDQDRRDTNPDKFERKPGGAADLKERGKDYREKKAEALLKPVRFFHIPSQTWGVIVGVSQITGQVTFQAGSMYQSRPLEEFFDEAVIGDDADYFFEYLDRAFDYDEVDEFDDIPELDDDGEALTRLALQIRMRPQTRQRRQRGVDKHKAKRNYRKNRAKSRMRSRKRYKRLRKNPSFKKQQQIRRKHPERFKRKRSSVLTAPEIAFVIGEHLHLGYVHNLSPMSGLVTYYRHDPKGNSAWLESLPVSAFLASVGFLSEYDTDAMFDLIDTELEGDPFEDLDMQGLLGSAALEGIDCASDEFKGLCEMLLSTSDLSTMSPSQLLTVDSVIINQMVYDNTEGPSRSVIDGPGDAHMLDPSDDDLFRGMVNLPEDYDHLSRLHIARRAEMLYEKVDRNDAPSQVFDRAVDRKDKKEKREPGKKTLNLSPVTNNPGSAKVIPEGHDFMNKSRLAFRIDDIKANVDARLREKAQGLPVKLKRVDARYGMWQLDVKGGSDTYRVKIKGIIKGNARRLSKADVLVSCSCPYWRWQGPEHWAKQNGYLFGKPVGTASFPIIKDPAHDHGVCKHVLAAFDYALGKDWSVPGAGKKKRASEDGLRYLADILRSGELWGVHTFPKDAASKAVAARYVDLEKRRS